MPVYVDNYRASFRNMKMSHLWADSLRELHEMALELGLKEECFRDKTYPHYDVCETKRHEAISKGAISVSWRDGAKMRLKQFPNKLIV